MYKCKLQELCHLRRWELPDYTTAKEGPNHIPRFTAVVKVNGQVFQTPAQCKSAKEAQNTAARIAFHQLNVPLPRPAPSSPDPPAPAADGSLVQGISDAASPPVITPPAVPLPEMLPNSLAFLPPSPLPSSLPFPPPGLLAAKNRLNVKPADEEVLQPEENYENAAAHTSVVHRSAAGSHDKSCKDRLHIYKNLLQQFAQKQNLGFPVYTCEAEGPPHARRFKSRVTLDGKTYETLEFVSTLKEAEQTAAKVACEMLSVDVDQEDQSLYKNLLQEVAQREGFPCPSYETILIGLSHMPVFVSTVTIGSEAHRGAEAKTKKQAEMNAAKVAYCAFMGGGLYTKSSVTSSINICADADNLMQNIQPVATIKHPQDMKIEESQIQAKKAKSLVDEVKGDIHKSSRPHPLIDLNMLMAKSTSTEPLSRQSDENQLSYEWKTVVLPRKLNFPMPEGASVVTHSDDQWVAYRIKAAQ